MLFHLAVDMLLWKQAFVYAAFPQQCLVCLLFVIFWRIDHPDNSCILNHREIDNSNFTPGDMDVSPKQRKVPCFNPASKKQAHQLWKSHGRNLSNMLRPDPAHRAKRLLLKPIVGFLLTKYLGVVAKKRRMGRPIDSLNEAIYETSFYLTCFPVHALREMWILQVHCGVNAFRLLQGGGVNK